MSLITSLEPSQREALILAHLPQVQLIATRMHLRCPRHVEVEDLISAGTVGLIQAVDRFRPERGCMVKTLAEHRIRGAILDYMRKIDPLRRRERTFVKARAKAFVKLEGEFGRAPVAEELAEAVGLPIERYRRLEWAVRASKVISLESIGHRNVA
jgi:RNA polymerase sigma factor for flagellar operon FliA